jgi:hypothetical protein
MCIEAHCAPPELGLVCDRFGYKHSAPPELNAFGCGSAAPCLCGETI